MIRLASDPLGGGSNDFNYACRGRAIAEFRVRVISTQRVEVGKLEVVENGKILRRDRGASEQEDVFYRSVVSDGVCLGHVPDEAMADKTHRLTARAQVMVAHRSEACPCWPARSHQR